MIKKKEKIAFVPGVFFPDYGGAQIQCHNIANKLVEKRFDIDVFSFKKHRIKNNKYNFFNINNIILKLVFVFNYYFKINLEKLLEIYLEKYILRNKYKLWHFHFINYKSLILINILKRLNQKIIVTFQGIDIQKNKKIGYGYRLNNKYDLYLKKNLKNIDYFFYISETIKKDLLKLGVSIKKLRYFPNSINFSKFNSIKSKDGNPGLITLLTVARYAERKKGFDRLPKVAKYLIEQNINFKWIIVGSGVRKLMDNNFIYENRKFFNIINNIKNEDEYFFPHSKLIKIYKSCDIYVNLSRIESFGITYVEALASKLPIFSFNIKGANEIIKNNTNGVIIMKNDLKYFSIKLKNLIRNPKKLKKLKSNSLIGINKFFLDNSLKNNMNIYSD